MEVASSRWGESHAAYASFAWCRAGRSAPRALITDSHHLPQANGRQSGERLAAVRRARNNDRIAV